LFASQEVLALMELGSYNIVAYLPHAGAVEAIETSKNMQQ
jgi:hypothetical protein